ncbi:hypothetical protein KI387_019114, partial [Taxus chinensis]
SQKTSSFLEASTSQKIVPAQQNLSSSPLDLGTRTKVYMKKDKAKDTKKKIETPEQGMKQEKIKEMASDVSPKQTSQPTEEEVTEKNQDGQGGWEESGEDNEEEDEIEIIEPDL